LKTNSLIHIKKILPIIGIAIFLYIVSDIGLNEIISTFSKISLFHIILLFLVAILATLFQNVQWQLILKKQKIKISFFESLKALFISDFYKSVSPAFIGTWMKVPYLKEETDEPYGKLFINCLFLSTIATLAFLLFLIIGAFFSISKIPIAFPIAVIWAAVVIAIMIFFIKKERGEKGLYLLIKLFAPKKLKPTFKKFVETFYKDFLSLKDLTIPFIMGFIGMIYYFSMIYIIALALDINIPYFTFIMVYPIITAVSFLPISPGSIGIRELTAVYILSIYGVGMAEAVVLSLSSFLLLGGPSIIIGFIFSIGWLSKSRKEKIKSFSIEKLSTVSYKP